MAGIAKFLDLVHPFLGFGIVVFDGAIDEQEPAAGLEHTRRFEDEIFRRTEVMRRNAAGYEIERSVGVGKLFGGVLAGRDLEAAFGGGFRGAVEHGLGEVRERHVMTKAGEVKSGVTATRR